MYRLDVKTGLVWKLTGGTGVITDVTEVVTDVYAYVRAFDPYTTGVYGIDLPAVTLVRYDANGFTVMGLDGVVIFSKALPGITCVVGHAGIIFLGTGNRLYGYNFRDSVLISLDETTYILHGDLNAGLSDVLLSTDSFLGVSASITALAAETGTLWIGTEGGVTKHTLTGNSSTHWTSALGICESVYVKDGLATFITGGAGNPVHVMKQSDTNGDYNNAAYTMYHGGTSVTKIREEGGLIISSDKDSHLTAERLYRIDYEDRLKGIISNLVNTGYMAFDAYISILNGDVATVNEVGIDVTATGIVKNGMYSGFSSGSMKTSVGDNFSLSCWVEVIAGRVYIAGSADESLSDGVWILRTGSGNLQLGTYNGGWLLVQAPITIGKHLINITVNNNYVNMFIDGVVKADGAVYAKRSSTQIGWAIEAVSGEGGVLSKLRCAGPIGSAAVAKMYANEVADEYGLALGSRVVTDTKSNDCVVFDNAASFRVAGMKTTIDAAGPLDFSGDVYR